MDGNERRSVILQSILSGQSLTTENHFYEPKDDDIIIVGPPKSGTTWLQQILHQLRTKGDESFRDIYDVTYYIDSLGCCNANIDWNTEEMYKPRIYKHHESYGVIKTTNKQKHIVITRDPYDTVYSYQKWVNRFYGGDNDLNDEECADALIDKERVNKVCNYRNVASWFEHRNDTNVLLVFYEDFVKNLKLMLKKVADFVGIILTPEEMNIVYRLCSFEYMAKNKEKFQAHAHIENMAKIFDMEKWSPKLGMVREDGGKVGQGDKNINPKLRATIDQLWQENIGTPFGFKDYHDMYTKFSILC